MLRNLGGIAGSAGPLGLIGRFDIRRLGLLNDQPEQRLLREEVLTGLLGLVGAQGAVAVGVCTEEKAAGEQVSDVGRFFLRDLAVIVGVGQLEEHLAGVLQVLNAVNWPDADLRFVIRDATGGSEGCQTDCKRSNHPEFSTHGYSPFLNPNAWKSFLDSRSGSSTRTELHYPAVNLPGRLEPDTLLQAGCHLAYLQTF